MNPVVVVMVKAPLPGFSKTRLTPPLKEDDAASLAVCFLQDVVKCALTKVSNVIIAFTPADGRSVLETSLPNQLLWVEQHGTDLGERLNSAVVFAHNLGFSPILVLGADSPTLPPSFIETAHQVLAAGEADVTLGPTTDGGYYLVGLRKPVREMFENITWSSPFTLEQTVRKIDQLGLRLFVLPQWYDVDTFADLGVLSAEVNSDPDARNRAPATHRWLSTHTQLRFTTD